MRIAIIDDEAEAQALLKQGTLAAAEAAGLAAEISVFSSAEAFLADRNKSYSLILLDIQMSGMNGMECAQRIRKLDQQAVIIFITSMVQYAVQGYKVNAMDYIVKPVTQAELAMSLNRAFKKLRNMRPQVITFRTPGGMTTVGVQDILFVEAVNHSAVARTFHGDIPCGMTLSAVENQLKPYGFFRCHAGFLVNLKLVEQVTATDAVVAERLVPVSKHRRRELMQAITAWWGGKHMISAVGQGINACLFGVALTFLLFSFAPRRASLSNKQTIGICCGAAVLLSLTQLTSNWQNFMYYPHVLLVYCVSGALLWLWTGWDWRSAFQRTVSWYLITEYNLLLFSFFSQRTCGEDIFRSLPIWRMALSCMGLTLISFSVLFLVRHIFPASVKASGATLSMCLLSMAPYLFVRQITLWLPVRVQDVTFAVVIMLALSVLLSLILSISLERLLNAENEKRRE